MFSKPIFLRCDKCGREKRLFKDIFKYDDDKFYCSDCKKDIPKDVLYQNKEKSNFGCPIGCLLGTLVMAGAFFMISCFIGGIILVFSIIECNFKDLLDVMPMFLIIIPCMYLLSSILWNNLYKRKYFKTQNKFFSMFGIYLREGRMEVKQEKKGIKEIKRSEVANKESFEKLEKKIGIYWLNRIGIVLIVIGLGFFAGYAFTKITPLIKALLGYLVGIGILAVGVFLEQKEKYRWYGRSLIGGGWAILCFLTFAIYHFEAIKIIQSQLSDILLLAIVVTIMTTHLLKYRSQIITGITFFLGYITACMSDISIFTLLYCTALAVGLLAIVYKMKWGKMLLVAIFFTYISHVFWFKPYLNMSFIVTKTFSVPIYKYWMSTAFLTLYWLLFNIANIFIKQGDDRVENAIVVCNAGFYSLFLLVETNIIKPEWKFFVALFVGLAYIVLGAINRYLINRKTVSLINAFIGISLITISLPLKFSPDVTISLWAIEIPILLYIGLVYKRAIYRIAAGFLSIFVSLKLLGMYDMNVVSYVNPFITQRLLNSFILCLCFFVSRAIYALKKSAIKEEMEKVVPHLYTAIAVVLFFFSTLADIDPKYLSIVWGAGVFILFLGGFAIKDLFVRFLALIFLLILILRIFLYDLKPTSTAYRILLFLGLGIVLMVISFIYTKILSEKDKKVLS